MNRMVKIRTSHYRVILGKDSRKYRLIPVANTGAAAAPTSTGGPDPDIHIGTDGGATLDGPHHDPELEKAVALVRASGLYLVEHIPNRDFCQSALKMIRGHAGGDNPAMIAGFAEVTDEVVKTAGGTAIQPPATSAPSYDGLPEASEATATTVEDFEVETHNAHADPQFLRVGGRTLKDLLGLSGTLTKAATLVGYTTAGLGRELADEVSAVVQSVQGEVAGNPPLSRSIQKAIDYTQAQSKKAGKTKKKIKAVKKKFGAGDKKPVGPGGLPAGATGSPGGTGAGGGSKGGIE